MYDASNAHLFGEMGFGSCNMLQWQKMKVNLLGLPFSIIMGIMNQHEFHSLFFLVGICSPVYQMCVDSDFVGREHNFPGGRTRTYVVASEDYPHVCKLQGTLQH